jgi:hypothetical protein
VSEKIKVYISHKIMCDILGVEPAHSLSDIEVIYRPDAEMWLMTAITDEEVIEEATHDSK